jgi:hypothetical protein
MNNVLEVTTTELNEVLANIEQVSNIGNIVHITQYTAPKTTKKCRDTKEPFNGSVNKLSNLSILLGLKYEKVVTNQLAKEGKDESEYKKGYNTMPIEFGSKNDWFGHFKGQAVIQYKPNGNSKAKTKYVLNSKMIDKGNLPNVLPTPSKATNQGTDKEVLWRKLYTKGIRRISINGQKYKVVNPS